MKIAVIGAGAVGGALAGILSRAPDTQTSLLARGPHLAQIRDHGLRVSSPDGDLTAHLPASDNPADLGPQDVLLVTVKGHSLPGLAPHLKPMIGPDTVVVAVQNGIPWWYLHGIPGEGGPLETVDPGAVCWNSLGPDRAAGCIVHILPGRVTAPGCVTYGAGPILDLGGAIPGSHSEILAALAQRLGGSSGRADNRPSTVVVDNIREPLWRKLMLNLATGPTAVLTGATMGQLAESPDITVVKASLMRECMAVASAWGITIEIDIDKQLAQTLPPSVAAHKVSLLQDLEAGRAMEVDPMITAMIDLAHRRHVPVPLTESLRALMLLRQKLKNGL